MNELKEKDIEKMIIEGLRWRGIYCQKIQSGSMLKSYQKKSGKNSIYKIKMADEGTPDIMGCIDGKFFAIEVKRNLKEIKKWDEQKDARSRNQYGQHSIIRQAGGVVIMASSLDEVLLDLKSLNYLHD